jgi:hypothetical protein
MSYIKVQITNTDCSNITPQRKDAAKYAQLVAAKLDKHEAENAVAQAQITVFAEMIFNKFHDTTQTIRKIPTEWPLC